MYRTRPRTGDCRNYKNNKNTPPQIHAEVWFGNDLEVSMIKTCLSAITNMFTGVTLGYKYKMRFAYAHFPVGVTVEGNEIQIRNFLGEKYVRRVTLPEGITVCLHLLMHNHNHTQPHRPTVPRPA